MDFDHSFDTISPDNIAYLSIGGVGGLTLPSGSTVQRPGTPVNGLIRYNNTDNVYDLYQQGAWHRMMVVRDFSTTGITAAGTTQGTATAISSLINVVSSGIGGSGVILPTPQPGDILMVVNGTGVAINVYPPSGGALANLGTNVAFSQSATTVATWVAQSASQYQLQSYVGTSPATVTSVDVSGGTTGLTTSGGPITTSGTITLAGTLGVANGGTGLTTSPTNGALDIGNGTGFVRTTLTQGTGITITNAAGSITIANAGVTSVTGTANQITTSASTGAVTLSLPSAVTAPGSLTVTTNLTVSGLTANSFLYSGAAGLLSTTAAPTNGQLLIGSTGAAPVAATLTQGPGITITNAAGSITIANSGAASVVGTANQITAATSSGAVILSLPAAVIMPGTLTANTLSSSGATITGGTINGTTIGATTPSTGAFTSVSVGTLGYSPTNVAASFAGSIAGSSQVVHQNTSAGTTSSTDIVVANNAATTTTNFGKFGINSSAFAGSSNSFGLATATYVAATSGDLVLGTTTSNVIRFVTAGASVDWFGIGADGQWNIGGSAGTSGFVFTSGGSAAAPTWTNPATLVPPGGTASAIQYNNGTGGFGGSSTFTYNGSGLMSILSSSATILMQDVSADPSAPAAGNGYHYVKDMASRLVPMWMGPDGLANVTQRSHAYSSFYLIRPNGATTGMVSIGTGSTIVGTLTTPAQTSTNVKTSMARTLVTSSATTAGTLVSLRTTNAMLWRGNAAGLGGFEFVGRFGLDTVVSANRAFFGIADVVTAPTNIDPTTSTTPGKIGMAINTNTGNWNLVNNVTGTAPTVLALGINFPVDTTTEFELALYCPPNGSAIGYRITNLTTRSVTTGSLTTNIPATTTFLAPWIFMTNNTTTATFAMNIANIAMESYI
jgi:hypothetical protein